VVDLTIVTCLAPCLAGDASVDDVAQRAAPLLESDIPVVAYTEDASMAALQARFPRDSIRFHATSAERRWNNFGLRAELQSAWARAADGTRPGLDYCITTLSKMGMLHDQSIWNPFGTGRLVWIDADIAASVHPRYFSDERLLDALPGLLERFLFLTRPAAVRDVAGNEAASRVQGQLFGGELSAIPHANALYYRLLDDALRSGVLPSDEMIFTHMLATDAAHFDRVGLQDNALLGALFEEMRSGSVPVERTALY
jgi:hypothetical protein